MDRFCLLQMHVQMHDFICTFKMFSKEFDIRIFYNCMEKASNNVMDRDMKGIA